MNGAHDLPGLRQRLAEFEAVTAPLWDAVYIVDPQGVILACNAALARLTGYQSAELCGRHSTQLYDEDSTPVFLERRARAYAGEAVPPALEAHLLHRDGRRILVEATVTNFMVDGQLAGRLAVVRDLTERKHTEERFRALLESIPDAVVVVNEEGRIVLVNRQIETVFGYTREALLGQPVEMLLPTRFRALHTKHRAQYQSQPSLRSMGQGLELYGLHKSGQEFPVEISLNALPTEQGWLILSAIRDVTAQKQAQDIHAWLAAIVEHSDDAIIGSTPDARITSWNAGAQRMYGYTAEEVRGRPLQLLVPSELEHELPQITQRVRYGEHIEHYETVRLRKDGTRLDVSLTISPIRDASRRIVGISIIARDITERKRAAELLKQQRDWLDVTLTSIGDGVITTDAQGLITRMNPTAERLTGWTVASAVGRPLGDVLRLVHAHTHAPADDPVAHVLRTSGPVRLGDHLVLLTRQGAEIAIDDSAAPILTREGVLQGIVLIFQDVTERRQMEEKLRQTQKIQALGTLAGGIAHDFNNILSSIFGYTELAMLDLPDSSPTYAYLQRTLTAAQRAKDLVAQLLMFSRRQKTQRQPLDLAFLAREAVAFLRAILPTNIVMQLQATDAPALVLADTTEIYQVLMNLCTNAGQAMRATGGQLTVRLERVQLETTLRAVQAFLKPGAYIALTVQDTGPGMTPEMLERIFEPFFTTKPTGEGTGLGLAVVYGIVTGHDGGLTVESVPAQGTTFTVYLPSIEQSPVASPPIPASLPHGSECILLVEDEENVIHMAQTLLTRLGYTVVAYMNSMEALEAFRATPARFDLLITDYMMPQMTGDRLLQACREIRPGLPCILCTGFSETIDADASRALGIEAFLMKPWSIDVLAQTIRRVLASRLG